MKRLIYTFPDQQRFLENYRDREGRQELFLPRALAFRAGEPVILQVNFQDSGFAFQSVVKVVSRRYAEDRGTLVNFLQPEGRDLMVAYAKGESIEYQPRKVQRVDCTFPVKLYHEKLKASGEAVDYSPGGIQVRGGMDLDVGDSLELTLYPSDTILGLNVTGQVAWIQRKPKLTCGIALHPTRESVRRRLHRLYVKLLAPHAS